MDLFVGDKPEYFDTCTENDIRQYMEKLVIKSKLLDDKNKKVHKKTKDHGKILE